MQLPIEIREAPQFRNHKVNGQTFYQPFGLVEAVGDNISELVVERKFVPVWFQQFSDSDPITVRFPVSTLAQCVVYGKPISDKQTLSDYASLPHIRLSDGASIHKANMIGLYEHVKAHGRKAFRDGDGGAVYLLRVRLFGHSFYSTFADSYGAAKRFIVSVDTEFRLEMPEDEMEPLELP